jgi:GMP synthase (glutamine-hydrolysing)
MRFLIIDGYDKPARNELVQAGASLAGALYKEMLLAHRPQAHIDLITPADADCDLPDLSSYGVMLWTGSSLTAYDPVPAVQRQIELARAGFELGLKAFGSCWALQIAAIAAGGSVRKNPNGREFGLARKITLTPQGLSDPVFAGREYAFDGFSSHFDEVDRLPDVAQLLAGNYHTSVQAARIFHGNGAFLGLQYHPEYNLAEIAALARFRAQGLVSEGRFNNLDELTLFDNEISSLDKKYNLKYAWKYGVDDDVLDPQIRQNEFKNWLMNMGL